MPSWKKVIVSGSDASLNSLLVTGNTIITGSLAVGTSSIGPSENTITLGARDSVNEGGQIGFNAPGGTYTSASFIDNWQNKARILKGNNTTSTGLIAQWDIHTAQMQLPAYNNSSAFIGTPAGYLAFDTSGNLLTVAGVAAGAAGTNTQVQYNNGGVLAGTPIMTITSPTVQISGSTSITGSLTATNAVIAQANGAMYFRGGDDAELWDINISNHLGIYGQQDATVATIKLGSGGGTISGKSGNIGIGTINPTSASLTVNGNVWATSFTGSLQGTSSFAITSSYAIYAATASYSTNASDILIYVKNTTGAQINKGNVVRITGATGDNALISTASYESDLVSANTLGITREDIPNDAFGYVITEGTLLGINTDLWTAGQLLFLGANGSITGSAPLAPLHAVRLGQVLRVQSNNGSMYVRIDNGYELGELHDVSDNTTTTSYGDLLVKSGSVWTNSRQLTGSYGITGSLTITGSTSTDLVRITQTGTGNAFVVEDSANPDLYPFTITNTGDVGIGTLTPRRALDVGGTIYCNEIWNTQGYFLGDMDAGASNVYLTGDGASSTNSYLDLATNGSTKLRITHAGNVGIGITTPTASLHINNVGTGSSFLVEDSTNPDSTPFVIDANGNVGIGGVSLSEKLNIDGNINLISSTSTKINIESGAGVRTYLASDGDGTSFGSLTNHDVVFYRNNSEFARRTATGFGIGTATPGANLEVYGVGDSVALVKSAGNSYLKLNRGILAADAHISFDTTTTQKHIVGLINNTDSLIVGGTEAAPVITVSGSRVGIGTTTPSASLHIKPPAPTTSGQSGVIVEANAGTGINLISDNYNSNQSVTTFGRLQSTMAAFLAYAVNQTGSNTTAYQSSQDAFATKPTALELGNGYFALKYNTSSLSRTYGTTVPMSTALFMDGSSGRIGIGTQTPQAIFQISSSGYNELYPFIVGFNQFVVSSSGNVGIGTTTPQAGFKLDVSGSSVIRGNVYLDGSLIEFGQQEYKLSPVTDSYVSSGSNKFGIGTTTPNAKLDVNGNTIITGSLTVTNDFTVLGSSSIQYITSSQLNIGDNIISVNTINPGVRFGGLAVIDSGSSPQQSGSLLFDSQNNQWIFVHQSSAAAAVTSSVLIMGPQTFNNVGNETTLTANRLPKATSGDLGEHIGNSNITDTGTLVSINSNTEVTGNVGIGTASPSQKLDIVGDGQVITRLRSNETGSAYYLTEVNSNNTAIALGKSGAIIGTGTSNILWSSTDLQFYVNSLERARITSNGDVGIGTTTPNAKLDVNGNTIITGSLTINNSGAAMFNMIGIDHAYQSFFPQGVAAGRFGYFGYGSSGSTQLNIINEVANGNLVLGTAGSVNRLFISASGDVGIGTTTPNAKLDVNGDTIITGSLLITGSANVIGDTTITGSLTVTDKIKGTSSDIDTNALIQASLLYLSNNF